VVLPLVQTRIAFWIAGLDQLQCKQDSSFKHKVTKQGMKGDLGTMKEKGNEESEEN
jgi:hypothetical protein